MQWSSTTRIPAVGHSKNEILLCCPGDHLNSIQAYVYGVQSGTSCVGLQRGTAGIAPSRPSPYGLVYGVPKVADQISDCRCAEEALCSGVTVPLITTREQLPAKAAKAPESRAEPPDSYAPANVGTKIGPWIAVPTPRATVSIIIRRRVAVPFTTTARRIGVGILVLIITLSDRLERHLASFSGDRQRRRKAEAQQRFRRNHGGPPPC